MTDGPTIFMKRDDLTGLAFGGNKTGHLEFTFAALSAGRADMIVGGANVTPAALITGLRAGAAGKGRQHQPHPPGTRIGPQT